ncbi:hypothetical protein Plano_2192 [Planococcus sp. PAMC 21323]|uniref:hypothetical protein n=1 Tax=Planococcus sp. PAMC 21323 TaxID=1526927 RepID=UPI00058615A4|nr:hypothetical protein [Planococcus sp. PAMC 21323]AIY06157.1 hypothetical protein Plano_2192 [Planococcus sp. PAMC 21323]
MEHKVLDPREVELRLDEDFNAILNMIGEGAPVFSFDEKEKIFRAQQRDEKIAKELH